MEAEAMPTRQSISVNGRNKELEENKIAMESMQKRK